LNGISAESALMARMETLRLTQNSCSHAKFIQEPFRNSSGVMLPEQQKGN
jgi:hypothetical protein